MSSRFALQLLSTLAVAGLAACSSTPVQPPAAPPAPTAAAAAPKAPPMGNPAPVAPQAAMVPAYLDPSSPVYRNRSVWFDFDESTIRAQDKPTIETQGSFLGHNAAVHVRVEGNTDERGGSEYNLALGQRRAQAVKQALMVYGVKESQVEAVSYGKERPKASGHDEASWSQNRRADVVYPAR